MHEKRLCKDLSYGSLGATSAVFFSSADVSRMYFACLLLLPVFAYFAAAVCRCFAEMAPKWSFYALACCTSVPLLCHLCPFCIMWQLKRILVLYGNDCHSLPLSNAAFCSCRLSSTLIIVNPPRGKKKKIYILYRIQRLIARLPN